MMAYTDRLSVKVAAVALVTFSASCFLTAPSALAQAVKKPEYAGAPENPGAVGSIVSSLNDGAVVIVLDPDDGSIIAHALQRPGSGQGIKVYQKDENGDNIWYNDKGQPEDPPNPPVSAPDLKGAGDITDLKIYMGSDCVMCNLNGKWITVCK